MRLSIIKNSIYDLLSIYHVPDVLLFSLILLKPQNHEEGIWESSEGFPEGLLSQLTNEG